MVARRSRQFVDRAYLREGEEPQRWAFCTLGQTRDEPIDAESEWSLLATASNWARPHTPAKTPPPLLRTDQCAEYATMDDRAHLHLRRRHRRVR